MKLPFKAIVLGLLTLPVPLAIGADNALKPGTYRVRTEIKLPDAPQPTVTTEEECLTVAEARDAYTLLLREINTTDDDDCTNSNMKSAGGKVTFDKRCGDQESKVEMTFGSDWYKADVTTVMGRDVIAVKLDARWVKADCTTKSA
jgi:hypothetical protein